MTTIYHKHHIVPKHAGGSDDVSNLIRLTVPEHAEAHRKLFEQYGRLKDYVAWKALDGMGFTPEFHSMLTKEGIDRVKETPAFKERQKKNAQSMWQKPGMRERLVQKRKEQNAQGNNPMQGKKQKRACCIRCHKEFAVNSIIVHLKKCN